MALCLLRLPCASQRTATAAVPVPVLLAVPVANAGRSEVTGALTRQESPGWVAAFSQSSEDGSEQSSEQKPASAAGTAAGGVTAPKPAAAAAAATADQTAGNFEDAPTPPIKYPSADSESSDDLFSSGSGNGSRSDSGSANGSGAGGGAGGAGGAGFAMSNNVARVFAQLHRGVVTAFPFANTRVRFGVGVAMHRYTPVPAPAPAGSGDASVHGVDGAAALSAAVARSAAK